MILNIVWPSTISNNNWPFSQLLYCIYLLVCIVVGKENNLNKKEWLSEPAVKCSKNSCIINEWLIYTHFFQCQVCCTQCVVVSNIVSTFLDCFSYWLGFLTLDTFHYHFCIFIYLSMSLHISRYLACILLDWDMNIHTYLSSYVPRYLHLRPVYRYLLI